MKTFSRKNWVLCCIAESGNGLAGMLPQRAFFAKARPTQGSGVREAVSSGHALRYQAKRACGFSPRQHGEPSLKTQIKVAAYEHALRAQGAELLLGGLALLELELEL